MAIKIFATPPGIDAKGGKSFAALGAGVSILKSAVASFTIPDIVTEDQVGRSYLGTPVIDNLEFPAGAYTDLDGNTITYGAVVIDTVIFEVSKPRHIVKTSIQGRNGDVKEYISDGDYIITCRGIISNKDNVIPESQIRAFVQVMEVPQQLPVVSLFLNDMFEIFNIVIERWNVMQADGKRNEVPFSFTASSDVDLGLEEIV